MLINNTESLTEKWANIVTHGLGAMLSISVFIYFLYSLSSWTGLGLKVGLIIFSLALTFVYLASTFYHVADAYFPKWTMFFRKLDHISIYTLIAGTQTPFILLYLNNTIGVSYLIVLWSLVLLGVLFKIFLIGRYKKLSVSTYVGLGWLVLAVIPFMFNQMDTSVFVWILIGGISYSGGVAFYLWTKLKFNHAIWHIFVLVGSASHFTALNFALT